MVSFFGFLLIIEDFGKLAKKNSKVEGKKTEEPITIDSKTTSSTSTFQLPSTKCSIPFFQPIHDRCNPNTFVISLLITPLPLPPMDTLSIFSNGRFTTLHPPPYLEPTPFVPWSPPTIRVFTLWDISSKRVAISSYLIPPFVIYSPILLNHILPTSVNSLSELTLMCGVHVASVSPTFFEID